MPPAHESFPSTRWTLIARLHNPDVRIQQEALAEILTRYMPAIRSYLTAVRRFRPDVADDLLHDFLVSKVLQQQLIHRASQDKGRFRSFLLASLDRFLISRHRSAHARKRAAGTLAALQDIPEPQAPLARPEESFDLAWARQLLAEAVGRMQEECRQAGREDIWGIFEHRILAALEPGTAPWPYDQLVLTHGLKSPAHASNVLITAKRMFARILRSLVAEYEPDDARIDAEIAELHAVLARASNGGS